MKDNTVHLLFFVLAIVAGFAAGVSGAFWWADREAWVLWLAAGVLVVGLVILVLQAVYIAGSAPSRPEHGPRARPRRTEPAPGSVEPAPSSGTRVRTYEPVEDDEETRGPAARALRAYRVD